MWRGSKYASEQCAKATLMRNSQFYMYFIIFRQKKCATEVEEFKVVCLEKSLLEIALAALNNLRGDKIKISK